VLITDFSIASEAGTILVVRKMRSAYYRELNPTRRSYGFFTSREKCSGDR